MTTTLVMCFIFPSFLYILFYIGRRTSLFSGSLLYSAPLTFYAPCYCGLKSLLTVPVLKLGLGMYYQMPNMSGFLPNIDPSARKGLPIRVSVMLATKD